MARKFTLAKAMSMSNKGKAKVVKFKKTRKPPKFKIPKFPTGRYK